MERKGRAGAYAESLRVLISPFESRAASPTRAEFGHRLLEAVAQREIERKSERITKKRRNRSRNKPARCWRNHQESVTGSTVGLFGTDGGHFRRAPGRVAPYTVATTCCGKAVTPYRVWVMEIMLQQTQVSAVVPFLSASWNVFRRFPNWPAHRSMTCCT